MHRKQLSVFFTLLAGLRVMHLPIRHLLSLDQLTAFATTPIPDIGIPPVVLGLANAGIVLVVYGLLGLAGYGLARKLGLPGISPGKMGTGRIGSLSPWRWASFCGLILVLGDNLFDSLMGLEDFHNWHSLASLLSSLSAGIGEEIAFRGFVFGLWAFTLRWLFWPFQWPHSCSMDRERDRCAGLRGGASRIYLCDDGRYYHRSSKSYFAG